MRQARHAFDPTTEAEVPPLGLAAIEPVRPRRAARGWWASLVGWRRVVALSLAVAVTGGSVALAAASPATVQALVAPPVGRVTHLISRSDERALLADPAPVQRLPEPEPAALRPTRTLYTAELVTVHKAANATSSALGTIAASGSVTATPDVVRGFRKVTFRGETGWVADEQLDPTKPSLPTGTSMTPCDKSSSIEAKIRPDTKFIFRSVCANFPQVHSYGGWRAGGLPFHRNGRAIDIMLTPYKDSAYGHRIADYLIAHAKLFNIDHIIFEQHIWTPRTPHWRKMADRGGITANHFDHVHVAVRA